MTRMSAPPVPPILATIMDVVRAAVAPVDADPLLAHLRDPFARPPGDAAIVASVLDRLDDEDLTPTDVQEAIFALCAAGWLRRIPIKPSRCRYMRGPLADLLTITEAHEAAFAAGRAQRRTEPEPWPWPVPRP